MQDYTLWSYLGYLAISVALTIWVGRTLYKNGRIFLVDAFLGNEKLADSVNHLLLVGWYLVNVGYVSLALKLWNNKPTNEREVIEFLSFKVGLVLLVLGAMHFMNVIVIAKWRKRAMLRTAPPPIRPGGYLATERT
jgi:hypothetical protein